MKLMPAPFRSLLFVPATAQHLLPKAPERGADALIVDLEDSIPVARKDEARALARAAIAELAERGARVLLRVNSEADAWPLDLRDMPLQALSAVMLPKVESTLQLAAFASILAACPAGSEVPVVALIETPAGVLAADRIAAHPALCAIGFGSEDYAGALGVAPSPMALCWPAQRVVTCAAAYGLQRWGLAASVAEVGDLAALERSVEDARAMGFNGSVCIHPKQVPVVNRGFSPGTDELVWAARVVEADRQAAAAGQGAVLLDGRMIDRPIVERARRLLATRRET